MKRKAVMIVMLACTMGFAGCANINPGNVFNQALAIEKGQVEKENVTDQKIENVKADAENAKAAEKQSVTNDETKEDIDVSSFEKDIISGENNVKNETQKKEEITTENEKAVEEKPEAEEKENTSSEADLEKVFENESDKNASLYGSPVVFNMQKHRFVIPTDYNCVYVDGIGTVIYIDNVFSMKLGVRNRAFSELLNDLPSTTSKAVEAGAEVLQEPKVVEIDGKKYIYFVAEIGWTKTIVVLSESPDENCHLGGQIAVTNEDVEDEEFIHMYASIISNTTLTEERDSTKEEIDEQCVFVMGERKEEATLKFGKKTVDYKVPEGFYYLDESNQEDGSSQYYDCATFDAYVYLAEQDGDYDAKRLADLDLNFDEGAKLDEYEINGRKVYVITYTYDFNDHTYNQVTGYCDLEGGYVLTVDASNRDKVAPTFELIKGFFESMTESK